jgi:hypothetical protein
MTIWDELRPQFELYWMAKISLAHIYRTKETVSKERPGEIIYNPTVSPAVEINLMCTYELEFFISGNKKQEVHLHFYLIKKQRNKKTIMFGISVCV